MIPNQIDEEILAALRNRVGRIHLRQRLGMERAYEHRLFGQGRNFFHIENLRSLRTLLRLLFKVVLLQAYGRRSARRIRVRHNHVRLPGLPAAFEGFTLLQISDLHIDMAPDYPHVLGSAVRDLDYDLCVLTGDYRAETCGTCQPALDALRQVRPQLREQVFAVLGNHDSISMVPAMEAMGIRMLMNEHVRLERGGQQIYLAGIDDPHYYRADNLEKAADDIPDNAVSVLLAHSPEIYRAAAHADFDLLLCGHTHGGQICLPGGVALVCNVACRREFCKGAWRYLSLQGYTSAGSGACVVDARINCPPEVTLHHLHAL